VGHSAYLLSSVPVDVAFETGAEEGCVMVRARPDTDLGRIIRVVCLAGLICLGISIAAVVRQQPVAPWRVGIAFALPLLAELAAIPVRRGGTRHLHNWRETAFVLGLFLVPAGMLALVMSSAVSSLLVLRRRPAKRILFNGASVLVETVAGAAVAAPLALSSGALEWDRLFTVSGAALVLLASLCPAVISTLSTAAAVATAGGRPLTTGLTDALRIGMLIWLRNVGAAFVIIASLSWSPLLTVVVVLALLVLQFFSADRTAIRQERFAWQRLREAIDQLRDVDLDDLVADATTAAVTMMRADAAEIHVYAKNGYSTVLRARDVEDVHVPDADDAGPDHSMDVPLSTREGRIGELRLLFSHPVKLNSTESACLAAFANALAVAIANALKFDAIREEAYRRIRAAYVDPVTGVGNLMMLEEESRDALVASSSSNLTAIAVIGLNRFAEVNDLLGAHAADQMLRAVATRLSSVIRRVDVVARLHGAEYVLLLRELGSESAAVSQAESAVRALGTAITADGLDLTVDAHTGVACAPTDGTDLDDLVRRARLAMYKARAEDLPVYRYQAELEPPAIAQVELVRELRDALSNRQLILHFQPKFRLGDGLPLAAEALVRWQHPERGLIPPVEFIPLLERCGLVGDLTRYVLEASVEECARWNRAGLPLSVAVNLSARNLLDEDLPRFVLECLSRHDLPTRRLICEITETAVFSRSPIAASVLDQLRAAGIALSLDDFCTGYSSLSLLRERTIDEIKIDRSFVADLGVEPRATEIVTALIELAHRCDILVTAEGIETREQQQLLTTLGCDQAQGYLLARPMPADQVRDFFRDVMKDAAVTPLPWHGHGPVHAVRRDAGWPLQRSWAEASSE
jgi:diguanylate cyclase (GGDEF)-like protein